RAPSAISSIDRRPLIRCRLEGDNAGWAAVGGIMGGTRPRAGPVDGTGRRQRGRLPAGAKPTVARPGAGIRRGAPRGAVGWAAEAPALPGEDRRPALARRRLGRRSSTRLQEGGHRRDLV